MRTLRLDGESEEAFRARVEQAALVAKKLIESALANPRVQAFIADPALPWTENGQRMSPTVRVEYEEAVAIGGIGECLAATRSKHWGAGPWVRPLRADDPVDPMFLLYIYRENSRYNRRFEQRRRMKEVLGREFRPLVGKAKAHTKKTFLASLTERQAWAIRQRLGIEPGKFWRAAKGNVALTLPPRDEQVYFDFMDDGEEGSKIE